MNVLDVPIALPEIASDPSTIANVGWLYSKDDAGETELYFKDDQGRVTQITKDGSLSGSSVNYGAANATRVVYVDATGAPAFDADFTFVAADNRLLIPSIAGGSASGGSLALLSTTHATKGAFTLDGLTRLKVPSANVLEMENGGTAGSPVSQKLSIYGFKQDASNYVRLNVFHDGNNFGIDSNGAGTGASSAGLILRTLGSNSMTFVTNNVVRWFLGGSSGALLANTDNSVDIGATGANRPRDVWVSRNVKVGTNAVTIEEGFLRVPNPNLTDNGANYERGEFLWLSNNLEVRVTNAGSGSARSIRFATNNAGRWDIVGSTGHFIAVTDNALDIGQSGANRPRDLYLSRDAYFGNTSSYIKSASGFQVESNGNVKLAGSQIEVTGGTNNLRLSVADSKFTFRDGSAGFDFLSFAAASGNATFTPAARTSGSPTLFTMTGPAHTTLAASTEAIDANWNLARTVQFATGALATQRAFLIQAPTYAFVGASTLTTAATLAISGAPIAGTNATITNPYALWIQGGTSRFDGNLSINDAVNVVLGTGTGTQFGTATNQKIGFLGATPVARQASITTPVSDISGTKDAIDALITRLEVFGFIDPN